MSVTSTVTPLHPGRSSFLERRAAALAYRGRHRSLRGALTRAAAARRIASMEPEFLAAELRREVRRRGPLMPGAERAQLMAAANVLDGGDQR